MAFSLSAQFALVAFLLPLLLLPKGTTRQLTYRKISIRIRSLSIHHLTAYDGVANGVSGVPCFYPVPGATLMSIMAVLM